MFRNASGYKTQCGKLTLIIASDFDEWFVVAQGPSTIIRGGRAFTEEKAKAQAVQIANEYLSEKGEAPASAELEWTALESGEWLNWRA